MPKLSDLIRGTPPVAPAAPAAGAGAGQRMKLSQVMAPSSAEAPEPLPSVFRADSDFRERTGLIPGQMMWAAAKDTFGSEQGTAEYLARKANEQMGTLREGAVKVVQGADGEPLIELQDGTRYRLNDPGLDNADVGKLASNVAAFWSPAAWASRVGQAKNLGLVGRSGLQAGTAATTDAVLQAGFDEGRVDPMRVAASGVGGAGGEVAGQVLGAVTRKVSQLLGRGTSSRDAALQLAKDAGIPAPSPEILARLSSGLDEIKAGADPRAILGREEFGFLYTQGQRMADPVPVAGAMLSPEAVAQQNARFGVLSREEILRQAPGSAGVFRQVADHNAEKLGTALDSLANRQGVPAAASPSELVAGVAAKVRGQADELDTRIGAAYDAAAAKSRSAIGRDAVAALPDRLRGALREFDVNPETMPGTARTLSQVGNAAKVILASPEGSSVSGVTLRAIETQRRIINNAIGTAANPTDRAALAAVKREYDRWLDDAVETALVSGDPDALALLKNARGLRAEYGRRFEGGEQADKFIAGLLDGSRTPEELLNMAVGASQVSKAGGARFVERLRVAANNDPGVMDAMRAANLMRLTRGADGKPLDMGQIVRNIDSAEYSNASVMRALYTPAQWMEIKRLGDALRPLLAKGDFAKSSGSLERLMRAIFQKLGGPGLPVIGPIADAVAAGRNYSAAARTVREPLRTPAAPLPGFAPSGAAVLQDAAD